MNHTLRKVLYSFLILLAVLIISAIVIPFVFKDKITAAVKITINNNLNARVDFKEVGLTVFRSFPDLGLELSQLTVAGVDSFATDTLANIPSLRLDINIMSVIKGDNYQINSVQLKEPAIYARVLKSGKANWDIVKADPAASPDIQTDTTGFKAALKSYTIDNGKLIYDDASLGFYMKLDSLDHSGKGNFTEDLFTLSTKSDIQRLTIKYAGVPYLNEVKLNADLPIEIDMKQMKFSLDENQIHVNDLVLSLVGSLTMPNDTDMVVDARFNAEKSDFKNFLSLIPAIYSSSFKDMEAAGKFTFNGDAKGTYNEKSLPAFNFNLNIDNGKIKYPSLPSAINNIQVKALISNPDGVIDHTEIRVPSFHLEFGSVPVDGRLLVKNPVSDLFVDMALKGKLDLQQLTTIFPLKDMKLTGIVDTDVKARGKKSSIDKGRFQDFDVTGYMIANNFSYSGASVPKPVHISSAKVSFNPSNVTLSDLSAKIGTSDLRANGSLDNYLEYALNKNIKLRGDFDVKSNLLDINNLMGTVVAKQTSNADTAKLTVIEVPENIDFRLGMQADRVLYDNFDIRNAKGVMQVKDRTIYFKDMGLDMLDGRVQMNGSYATRDRRKPKIDVDFGIEKMSIQKAFSAINTVKLLAPIAKYTRGAFSTSLKFNSDLDANMMPIYSSLNASGLANIINAVVQGFEPLNKLSLALNTENFKKLELNNVSTKFQIENGKLQVQPFDVRKGNFLMNVQGSNGIDQSIDYKLAMNVPRELLGASTTRAANALMAKLNTATNSNIELGETIKVNALIGGTILKPSVKVSLAESKAAVKGAVDQMLADKKAELNSKAQQEVAALKEKAATQIQQRTDSVKKQVEAKTADAVKKQLNNLFKKKNNEEKRASPEG